jgi:hypothetical protein
MYVYKSQTTTDDLQIQRCDSTFSLTVKQTLTNHVACATSSSCAGKGSQEPGDCKENPQTSLQWGP